MTTTTFHQQQHQQHQQYVTSKTIDEKSIQLAAAMTTTNESLQQQPTLPSNYDNWTNHIYFYSIAMCLLFYFTVHRSFAFFRICIRASVSLHDRLFCGITRATLQFFHSNVQSRIVNRFSKDIAAVDIQLPMAMFDSLVVSCVT